MQMDALGSRQVRPRVVWMLSPGQWNTTTITGGMVVCDRTGRQLGVVARIYDWTGAQARDGVEASSEEQGANQIRSGERTSPEENALLEISPAGYGALSRRLHRSRPFYVPASAVHDVRGMTIRLWRTREALADEIIAPSPGELSRLQRRAAVTLPVYRPVLEWR